MSPQLFSMPQVPFGFRFVAKSSNLLGHVLVVQSITHSYHYRCIYSSMEHVTQMDIFPEQAVSDVQVVEHFASTCRCTAMLQAQEDAVGSLQH